MPDETRTRSNSPTPATWTDYAEQELRCNLGMVLGFSELLATDGYQELNPRQRAWVDHILTQGHRLQELIESSLVLARTEHGGVQRSPTAERIANMVRHVVKGSEYEAGEAKVALEAEYVVQEPSGRAMVDAQQMNSVMRSSLNCFIQATKPGGRIQVRVVETDESFEVTYDADPEHVGRPSAFSALMRASWECIFGAHGATIDVSTDPVHVCMRIPK